ncbi:EpsD family peptidyl-prolyl cis-trans isomerase [Glaciimonas immobilis]|uniref:EpsD family peptidyl-prolyl cis-trans isomerase n=1 Tax=Glaciimonas immobilis TaxID=728004 RepID=A0A840RW63_9BURK|nr:EpsD family peptidyl-prolyl cis-trans isomerase [Glaciimonas immobilis]KAF3996297.1 peptidyl-prolyl cis-trans isomerase, EpsD family [Glaciimonas immobilis]MBB5202125.1 EpsD family peptidyl-prolyl cis-trans isomerase [Glaciimonas immobilis]
MTSHKHFNNSDKSKVALRRNGVGILMLLAPLAAMALSGCSDRDKNIGKILVRVNGAEITSHQLDAELARASPVRESATQVSPAARKLALEALIERKILLEEAERSKMDRDPRVREAIEQYRTQAVVQAYLESQAGTSVKPSTENIDNFFKSHPELFSHRKVLDIHQLRIASQDFSSTLRAVMEAATSLDQVEAWLIAHHIAHVKTAVSYVSADLPADALSQLQNLKKNHLFVLKDGDRDLLSALTNVVESPIPLALAKAQIERYLMNTKIQEVAASEVARLRPLAKLEYLDYPDKRDDDKREEAAGSVTALNRK